MQLYNGDCLEIMQKMIDDKIKVDSIITSPPYNMCLRINSGRYISRWGWKGNKSSFSAKYNTYKDDLPMDSYFAFQDQFINKALQISDLVFYNIQIVTGNKPAVFRLMGKYAENIKEMIIWDKGVAQPAMRTGTLNSQFEIILVFQNSKPYNREFDCAMFKRGTETNVWNVKREKNIYHKASFPLKLIERILSDFTKEGDIIFDPFMGSGTTGVACKLLGRDFIGIELDKKYFEIAESRINGTEIKKQFLQGELF